jgi:hypothetical protein
MLLAWTGFGFGAASWLSLVPFASTYADVANAPVPLFM